MILQKRYKHFNRYREVAHTLAKHGFGFLIRQLGLTEFLKHKILKSKEEEKELSTGKRIRLVVEDLGTTFIKIGQILSTRADLLPHDWTAELSKLQDQVHPFSFPEVRKQVENELGQTLEELFEFIDAEPLAAASIGQVHRAGLKGGKEIVIKVQRPDIEETIKTDLEILFDLARLLEKHTDWAKSYELREAVMEFEKILMDELNYLIEGQNIDVFRRNFSQDPKVYIPEVYWDYTTKKVLTMEYIKGVKLNETKRLTEMGLDVGEIAFNLSNSIFKQIVIDGIFHGDPHPGNIMVYPDGRIVLLDFGIIGVIDDDMKEKFGTLLIAQVSRNTEALMRAFLSLGIAPPAVNRRELRQDMERLQHKYYDLPLSKIKLGETMKEFMSLAFQYDIRMPGEFTLLAKTLVVLEGLVSRLAPHISLMEIAEPFGRELIKRRISYAYLKKWVTKNVQEYGEIFASLPRQVTDLLHILERGQFKAVLEHKQLEKFMSEMNHMINRLSFSILLSSLILALALIIQRTGQSILWKLPLAEIGFIAAGIMGFWLLISIIRSGRF
ncbi:MAG: ABC transporter [Firmicutes bacterium HGW-Firmicutes-13]|nr:MAG: ABC transporter [Firmicutes bacterium HGW-Firmicutes-13]